MHKIYSFGNVKKSKIFNIFKQKFNNYIDRLHHLDDNETTPSFLPPLPPRLPPTPSILPPITPPHITPITPKENFLITFTLKILKNCKNTTLLKISLYTKLTKWSSRYMSKSEC